jgi:hypothetical protein
MKRVALVLSLVLVGGVSPFLAGPSALARTLCVDHKSGCFSTLQAAVDAAHNGDTIHIARGTYAGGVTIDASVNLVGQGARRTIIRGGGPVLTIGTFGASTEPTVSIKGVTITGGVTRSSPESEPFVGEKGVFALGGGVEIPPNSDFSGGATVTIKDSVITGNRVAPRATVPSGLDCPDPGCPFALAGGGGIDSWGTLTLKNTSVSKNRVGSASKLSALASDADGGAILNWQGPLTIRNSVIHENRATATAPNGRFAEGGGIMAFGGTVTVSRSAVTDNRSALASSFPSSVDQLANGGGLHITSNVPTATIHKTKISGNSVSMTNTVGDAVAFSGGIHVDLDVEFDMTHSVVAGNSVRSATLAHSSGAAVADSGAGEILGRISDTRITGNSVTVRSATQGDARALAGGVIFFGTMRRDVVSHNHVYASSPQGSVFVDGGGLVVDAPGVTLQDTTVRKNAVTARGARGSIRGGGIFDAPIPDGPPGGPLVLVNSSVTRNVLTASAGISREGGGIYLSGQPLTLRNSVIARNVPDQCFGCP